MFVFGHSYPLYSSLFFFGGGGVMLLSMHFCFFGVTISSFLYFFQGYLERDHIAHGVFIWWMDGACRFPV
jgi:hypothetical protein